MPITPQEALVRCIEHREIFHDEMLKLMRMIMADEMSPQMTSAILMGLRVKKETVGIHSQIAGKDEFHCQVSDGLNWKSAVDCRCNCEHF